MSYSDRFCVHFRLVKIFESLGRVLAPVHADVGTAARRDEVDGLDGAELAEHVREVVVTHEFRQVTHPQRCTTNWSEKRRKVNY